MSQVYSNTLKFLSANSITVPFRILATCARALHKINVNTICTWCLGSTHHGLFQTIFHSTVPYRYILNSKREDDFVYVVHNNIGLDIVAKSQVDVNTATDFKFSLSRIFHRYNNPCLLTFLKQDSTFNFSFHDVSKIIFFFDFPPSYNRWSRLICSGFSLNLDQWRYIIINFLVILF